MVWPLIAAMAGSVIMNEYQKAQAAGDDKKAKQLMNQMLDQYNGIEQPEFKKPEYTGLAYEDTAYNPITSKWEDVASDPAMVQKQQASLAALDQIAQSGGMTLTDKANINEIQGQAAMQDKARRDAIRQNMQMSGRGGGGMDLLSQLQSSQAATNQASQQGMDVAGMAQQRALDSIMKSGQMAGDIRQQGFGEQAQKAGALDAISQFNAQNTLQNKQYNAGQGMNAQQYNADMQNKAADMPNIWAQQRYDNSMGMAQGKAGAYGQGMGYYQGRAGQKAQEQGQLASGAMQAAAAYYGGKK